ncbi:hypothetical protein VOLCADRAFT_104497 [Volvox carteri f. nagariensis]|uniref:Pherophorin domain-containing protein n=1 Tax=Volvox carteri f. nagariensis TaxID=3068 RepID=D8TU05_VOLCA|nr:uncharacterized protein VOLCADRAFT_104497 [Volvox carteri f. nagariensis]EFJ49060.1 hypothetical protein VOLCADRAFT_104497 [Volvox carteri f. nagariensis]|eukprot:XP_002949957.1 hypothetical protein VOLCADRAFT_104497 [Volvox carteri f. nagariensis]
MYKGTFCYRRSEANRCCKMASTGYGWRTFAIATIILTVISLAAETARAASPPPPPRSSPPLRLKSPPPSPRPPRPPPPVKSPPRPPSPKYPPPPPAPPPPPVPSPPPPRVPFPEAPYCPFCVNLTVTNYATTTPLTNSTCETIQKLLSNGIVNIFVTNLNATLLSVVSNCNVSTGDISVCAGLLGALYDNAVPRPSVETVRDFLQSTLSTYMERWSGVITSCAKKISFKGVLRPISGICLPSHTSALYCGASGKLLRRP